VVRRLVVEKKALEKALGAEGRTGILEVWFDSVVVCLLSKRGYMVQ
jgi:hypothetical protein